MAARRQRAGGIGGAAAASGFDFQHRVAAWLAVNILAESEATPPWHLPADTTIEALECESNAPVDDIRVSLSTGGSAYLNVKTRVSVSARPNSDLRSVLDQFVQLYLKYRPGSSSGGAPQSLDPERDRLVLITSPTSPASVRSILPRVLERIRTQGQDRTVMGGARTRAEQQVLETVRDHVQRSWRNSLARDATDEDIRALLCLVHVGVLDLRPGEGADREAKALLRNSVLHDSSHAAAAWDSLVSFCARLAANRSRADRPALQGVLIDAGTAPRQPRSYQADIARLNEHSQTTANLIAHDAQLTIGNTTIEVPRRCTAALSAAAERCSHLLVVGAPGAGKSGAVFRLFQALKQEGRDAILLTADRISAASLGSLRAELGLDHEIVRVLSNWPSAQPGFLIVDALDAARSEATAAILRDLIGLVIEQQGRWHVVASIRKFDLRYGTAIQELFRGDPPTEFQDPEFGRVQHLNIPTLSDEELGFICSRSPGLGAVWAGAPSSLSGLLRVPFNLRLIADLVGEGILPDVIRPIRTQIELLDRYWLHRVIQSDGAGDAREAVLRKVCERMIGNRTLQVDRAAVVEGTASRVLSELLSSNVLAEWKPGRDGLPRRETLAFPHHILFDYAVARLVFRSSPTDVVKCLSGDPTLALVVRPSLEMHFRYLWGSDQAHQDFWDLSLRMTTTSDIPAIGKIIGPSVAAELSSTLPDLEPLCAAIEGKDSERRDSPEKLLRHVVNSLRVGRRPLATLTGSPASPWSAVAERTSGVPFMSLALADTVRMLLLMLCEHPENLALTDLNHAGAAARHLLAFALDQTPYQSRMVTDALECVCRTFESDPVQSSALIRRLLVPDHMKEHAFEEMDCLAREVPRLINHDLGLVEEVYRAAFTHEESSDASTQMGDSRILSLVSNRRQDFQLGQWQLANDYGQFLSKGPREATRALIVSLDTHVARDHREASDNRVEEFDFEGLKARVRVDYSTFWDAGRTLRHDDTLRMLDGFVEHLRKLANDSARTTELEEIVDVVVAKNSLAVLWRRLLEVATVAPTTLGKLVRPLGWAIPILTGYDTSHAAGEFLKVVFPLMDGPDKERVEKAILSIPGVVPASRKETVEEVRNTLLGCLSEPALVTSAARELFAHLARGKTLPPNEPPVQFGLPTLHAYGEEEYLAGAGVPVHEGPNRRIRELEAPLKTFAEGLLNVSATLEEIQSIVPPLRHLLGALDTADKDGVDPKQRQFAWGVLAKACHRAAKCDQLSCRAEAGRLVRTILLRASACEDPTPNTEVDSRFDEQLSRGGPAARVDAAAGLSSLARSTNCADEEVLAAVERMTADPVPAVRLQVASRLAGLIKPAPKLVWTLTERVARSEPSRGVLQGLGYTLGYLLRLDPTRVSRMTGYILDRVSDGPGADGVRAFCLQIFCWLYVWKDDPLAGQVLSDLASDPAARVHDTTILLFDLRQDLTRGPVSPADQSQDSARNRAVRLTASILRTALDQFHAIQETHRSQAFEAWSEEDRERARSLGGIVQGVSLQIYHAAKGLDDDRQGESSDRGAAALAKRRNRFYRETAQILDDLATLGFPGAIHNLLQTLEACIPVDRRGVLLRIGRALTAGKEGNYQYEVLGRDLFVRIVERYLAEYRVLFETDEECRKVLIETLDAFVEVGWEEALRLTYRLNEMFR